MKILFLAALLACFACAPRRSSGAFRVLPGAPNYFLRAPDHRVTPFPEVLERYTPSSLNWVDLRPRMGLRVENAYYRDPSRRNFANYLGAEVARFQVRSGGALRLTSAPSGVRRAGGQGSASALVPVAQRGFRHHRFFYEVLLHAKSELRGAVLLGAASAGELDRLAARLSSDPDSVCPSRQCTIFPDTCTVSLELEITLNGAPPAVPWGSTLGSVAPPSGMLQIWRLDSGRLRPVHMDIADPRALRLPLLPGDRVAAP